ncbi:trafficking protein particle complex subunit 2-like isoform X1 [Tripterygium wilfordii]|uniref:trafficking protein particle complex subunit 2-like isoform X1 n=1 Tax=Tripterygium wilfordii TaxID=458696 RepID=UPI0018F83340|nr:trafficking protein particle complex subunit 2-like isoform X1 [Tripterygium wilfordii]
MATTACFIIVSRNDIPIYEAEVGSAAKREDAAQLHQFVLHAALDIVQDLAWTTSAMFLKAVDRFNDLAVSVYVTAGHTRFMLLHDSRNDDGIKSFFQDVHERYIKIYALGLLIMLEYVLLKSIVVSNSFCTLIFKCFSSKRLRFAWMDS